MSDRRPQLTGQYIDPPPPKAIKRIEPCRPFPVETLPAVIRRFVKEGAAALGCDPSYLALPMLAQLASAIGNSRRIRLKSSWAEPAVIWSVIVANSGTLKSPAQDQALRPIRCQQQQMFKEFEQARSAYETAMAIYKEKLNEWKKAGRKAGEPPPEKPGAPVCERVWVSDITTEALADRLQCSPRGLLVIRDELAGWFGGFNQYKGGQGGDVAHWLEMHRAGHLMVDRKTGDKTTIYVPAAAVSITGTIQPSALQRCLTPEFFGNGMAARLLLAMPPRQTKRWSDAEIPETTVAGVGAIVDGLLSLPMGQDAKGDPEPGDVYLSAPAKVLWVQFYNQHAIEQDDLGGDELTAAWAKLEGYAARFALVVHLTRLVAQEGVDPRSVDEESMRAGIVLADWFGYEAKRVYAMLGETTVERDRRELIDLIQRRGGRVTVRDMMRGPGRRRYGSGEEWEQALNDLVEAKVGRWEFLPTGDKGGRPLKVFVLHPTAGDTVTVDGTPCHDPASGGSVTCHHVTEDNGPASVTKHTDEDAWLYDDPNPSSTRESGNL